MAAITRRNELSSTTRFEIRAFDSLNARELYELLSLRQRIFVVEQSCAYLDADGRDQAAHHVLGRDTHGKLVASARILMPGVAYQEHSIGRVVVDGESRGAGLARVLMQTAIDWIGASDPGAAITISAQAHLERFYASLGFVTSGAPYDEDGIPHLRMRRG